MEAILIIVLLVLALLLFAAELFVIGGVLGAFGLLLLIAAVALSFYYYGVTAGVLVLIASGGLATAILVIGFRTIRGTRAGRRLFLADANAKQEGFESADRKLDRYRGKTGVTVSELHPAGLADIEGERITVTTEGGFLEEGVVVEVIDIRYNQLVVQEKVE